MSQATLQLLNQHSINLILILNLSFLEFLTSFTVFPLPHWYRWYTAAQIQTTHGTHYYTYEHMSSLCPHSSSPLHFSSLSSTAGVYTVHLRVITMLMLSHSDSEAQH